jgi:hypothetical protein
VGKPAGIHVHRFRPKGLATSAGLLPPEFSKLLWKAAFFLPARLRPYSLGASNPLKMHAAQFIRRAIDGGGVFGYALESRYFTQNIVTLQTPLQPDR